jgi:ankyrin repeat protein
LKERNADVDAVNMQVRSYNNMIVVATDVDWHTFSNHKNGNTALHLATDGGHTDIVKMLVGTRDFKGINNKNMVANHIFLNDKSSWWWEFVVFLGW